MTNMELDFIREMFDSIAPKYDFLNRFLSLGQDIRWRRELVIAANLPNRCSVLDVACGTCDVSIEVKKQKKNARIVAADFSPEMLKLARKKILQKYHIRTRAKDEKNDLMNKNDIHLAVADALCLPFKKSGFDAVFIAFGIRNIMDRKAALKEFYNSLKKEGRIAILELTTPRQKFVKELYLFYFKKILPALGTLFSGNSGAYHYLPASVIKFPSPDSFARTIQNTGFSDVKWKSMTFGIVTVFTGTKKNKL